jgi:hypothetical protein
MKVVPREVGRPAPQPRQREEPAASLGLARFRPRFGSGGELLPGERRWRDAHRAPYPHEELTQAGVDKPWLVRERGNVAAQRVL